MDALIVENNIFSNIKCKQTCSELRVYIKDWSRVVPVLRWVLFVRQIFVSPHSEFQQHMYSSDPSPDTVSFMQLESRRAAIVVAGRMAAILDVAINVMRRKGCAVQNKGITLTIIIVQSNLDYPDSVELG